MIRNHFFWMWIIIYPHLSMAQMSFSPAATFLGTHAYERVGYHLHTAGDMNGDGYDDFLIGTTHNRSKGFDSGAAYLILGRKNEAWQSNVSLTQADARFRGGKAYDAAGYCLGGGGDINGDGYDDIVIGAPAGNDNDRSNPGHVFIIFGKARPDWGYDFILPNSADASFYGETEHNLFGLSVAIMGDMNGDGYDDILCSSPYDDGGASDAGKAYLILGKASGWSRDVSIHEADAIFFGTKKGALVGYSVDGVGDVNGDGIPDFAFGARDETKIYLFFGRRNVDWGKECNVSNADMIFYGEQYANATGWRVSRAGDVNADGYDDFLVGAPLHNQKGMDVGKVYLILGRRDGWNRSLSDADASFYGEAENDQAGYDVQNAGDVDHDGFDDFLIGAWYNDANGEDSGKMYLVRGKRTNWQRDVPLSQVENYFVGEHRGDYAGYSVSTPGDVNRDGVSDIIVSASYNGEAYTWGGKVLLFLGQNAPPELAFEPEKLNFGSDLTARSLTVTNVGSGVLNWQIIAGHGPDWFASALPQQGELSGGRSQDVIVTINRTNMAEGEYSGTIRIESNGGAGEITVKMNVIYPPMLLLLPSRMDFGASRTKMPMNVINTGGGRLEWQVDESAAAPWIRAIQPNRGILSPKTHQSVFVTVDRDHLLHGEYTQFVDVFSNGGSKKIFMKVIVSSTGFYRLRVNAGGGMYFDHQGDEWLPDRAYSQGSYGYVGGQSYASIVPIDGTEDDPLYQTGRRGLSAYRFDVPNGSYRVILHFAELFGDAMENSIDVKIEEKTVIYGLNIEEQAGKKRALWYVYPHMAVNDSTLDIEFSTTAGSAEISAIEITSEVSEQIPFTRLSAELGEDVRPIDRFSLFQNYPNPFNASTSIQYELPFEAQVAMDVFDVFGRQIATIDEGFRNCGLHSITWNPSADISSGVYFCRIDAKLPNQHVSFMKKMIYCK